MPAAPQGASRMASDITRAPNDKNNQLSSPLSRRLAPETRGRHGRSRRYSLKARLVFVLMRPFFHRFCGNLRAGGEYDYSRPFSTIALMCHLPTPVFKTKVSLTMYSERVILEVTPS